MLPGGQRLGPPHLLPHPCRRSLREGSAERLPPDPNLAYSPHLHLPPSTHLSGGSHQGSEGTSEWLSGPPEGPPCLTGGSGSKRKGLKPVAVGGAGVSVYPHPITLTSNGSTSTDVLKSLSSGCSMFPLRKKNLQPDRPVSCCRGGVLHWHTV